MKTILLLLIWATAWTVAENGYRDPFEPTVTRDESALLSNVMEVAATNTAAAIDRLSEHDFSKASPAIDFALGNLYFQAENFEAAVSAYRAAIKKLPRFRGAIMNLGRVFLLQGRTTETITLYQQLVADGQADAGILVLLGHAMLLENNPVSAETAYRQALLLHPKHDEAMPGLAKALLQQERFAEALALVGEILKKQPINQELWTLRTNAYLAMGKYKEALRSIEQARRLNCADAGMLATLGDLLLNQDQPQDALSAYEAAFDVEAPAVNRLLRAIDGFLMVEDTSRAADMVAKALTLREEAPHEFDAGQRIKLLRLQAELAQQQNEHKEARSLCEKILRLDPLDGRTMLLLADLQQAAGMLEDAVMTCERAARIKGFEADALIRQAQIEVSRERYSRAVPLLEAALAFRDQPHVSRYLEQIRRLAD